jgi:hypothetical protein
VSNFIIDYDAPQTIVDAFSGVVVVMSAIGSSLDAIVRQQDLVRCRKNLPQLSSLCSCFQCFIPSEFELRSEDPKNPV